ncbi:MAG: M1 family metallopeptidase [Hyphomonadaceae bacterium]
MTRIICKALGGVAAVALLMSCSGSDETSRTATPSDTTSSQSAAADIPTGQLPEGVTPTAYRIDLRTDPTADTFSGVVEIDVALEQATNSIYLHALDQTVASVEALTSDGTRVTGGAEQGLADGGVTRLTFEDELPAGQITVSINYTAPFNLGLAGLYKASQGGKDYLATQMEPIDARRAFPSFDEPRFKTPWSLTVTAPEGNSVIANGAETVSTVQSDGWVKHEFATTRPIQSYLVALAVGPYDLFENNPIPGNAIRPETVPLRSFAASGKSDQLETSHDATFEMLRIQEEYFNYPYPYGKLDLIAAPDFAYGAMENAGAIIYRESALLINERTSLGQKRGALTTHAHELAHQWFGNLVTPKWWNDIWLNEAFATWMSYKTMHAYDPDGGFDRSPIQRGIGAMGADALASARQIRNPINANGDILSAFDGITYSKGGHVLSMYENYLGESEFRDGIRLHMSRFQDGVADVNDFMASLAEGSGNDGVVESFKSFIFQPGTPFLNVSLACPADGQAQVTVTQNRYAPLGSAIDTNATWQVPFAMSVGQGNAINTVTQLLTDKTTTIDLEGACPSFVMPNAGGAGYWRFTLSDENWSALAENYDRLSGGEQMMFADSLSAAFSAGEVSAEAMLAGLAATPSGEWDAASIPLGRLSGLVDILDAEDQPAMRKFIAETYANQWEYLSSRTAAGLSQGDTLLRQRIYSMLINVAKDPELRADLKIRAGQYVGLGGTEPDRSALPASELGSGIAVATEEGGSEFFMAALAYALETDNQRERRNILNTLAGNGQLDDVAMLLDSSFYDQVQGQEALFLFFSAIGHEDASIQDFAWDAFKENFDSLLARVPEIRKPQMAGVAGSFCDTARTDAAEAFIESKGDLIPGYERPLAQAVERARLCAALTDAKKDELAAALK